MKAIAALLSTVIVSTLVDKVTCRSNWQILNGTTDMQNEEDDSGNHIQLNYYSELDEDTNQNYLYGTF